LTRTRGAANQSLYLARIVLAAWDAERERQRFPEAQITAAFLPAVQRHLREAYGWFLLSVGGVDDAQAGPLPRSTEDLAAPEPGRERAPELREFALLEREGWLADLISGRVNRGPVPREGLLGSDRAAPGFAVAARWAEELAATMRRMDDFLAES
jgi:hypothetical protein